MRRVVFLAFAIGLIVPIFSAPAHAQASRTWVSGVGDDANPCSRTAPCKTFAGAISKTLANGEINCIDTGGFGAVTITKAITIACDAGTAGVLVQGTNGIVIQAGVNDNVILRGLEVVGIGTGINGIRFLSGKSLIVDKCDIWGFTTFGIDIEPSGVSFVTVMNTRVSQNGTVSAGGGIQTSPGASGFVRAVLSNVTVASNFFFGVSASSTGPNSEFEIYNSVIDNNAGTGLNASGTGAVIRVGHSVITGNNAATSGNVASFGNNQIIGNATDTTPTLVAPH